MTADLQNAATGRAARLRAAAMVMAAGLLTGAACDADPPRPQPIAPEHSAPAEHTEPHVVRPAAVAGSWYPGDREELAQLVDGYLASAEPPPRQGEGPVRAIIAPHAGYRFSGPTAGFGARLLRGAGVKRVIVLGPAHRGGFSGLSIGPWTHYETPLGEIALDDAAIRRLKTSSLVGEHTEAHVHEHSIEMQLPLLQRAIGPDFELVPILVGNLDVGGAAQAAELLRPLLDEHTLLLISSDFTHYGPSYGYVPFPNDEHTAAHLRELDMGAYDKVVARNPAELAAYVDRTGITACGYGPLLILAELLPEDAAATLLHYTTSGDMANDHETSVSYLSVAFKWPHPMSPVVSGEGGLSADQLSLLHGLARRAVLMAVTRGESSGRAADDIAHGFQLAPVMRLARGTFVTLKEHGRLRGCIGTIDPVEPMYRAVIDAAVDAALHDRRFSPVREDELYGLDLEVSVLTPLSHIESPDAFDIGRQGIVLARSGRRAIFLPEVAPEQGWDIPETLTHLSRKAGLPEDAWSDGAQLWTFTTQAIEAPWHP